LVALAGFLFVLGADRDRMMQTQERIIEWQEHQDQRLYDLEVWKARMGVAYPIEDGQS